MKENTEKFPQGACIETIRYMDARPENLAHHNLRMNRTRQDLFGSEDFVDLGELIRIPDMLPSHVYKCRVTYTHQIVAVEWEPYQRRVIRSLQIVHNETIDYTYKYRQRHDLEKIYSQKKKHDDVLIVRNGYLTDAYVCNIALLKGDKWLTPALPLLKGTQRELLLEQDKIYEADIHLDNLPDFTHIRLFNAMMPWRDAIELPVRQIFH